MNIKGREIHFKHVNVKKMHFLDDAGDVILKKMWARGTEGVALTGPPAGSG
jgi:hypothetical protein